MRSKFPLIVQGSKQFSPSSWDPKKRDNFSVYGAEDIYIRTGSGTVGGAWGDDYPAEKDRADWVQAAPPLKDDRSNVNASHSHLETCLRQPLPPHSKQGPSPLRSKCNQHDVFGEDLPECKSFSFFIIGHHVLKHKAGKVEPKDKIFLFSLS